MDYKFKLKEEAWSIYFSTYYLCGQDPDDTKSTLGITEESIERKEINGSLNTSIATKNLKSSCLLGRYYTGDEYGYKPLDIIRWGISKGLENIPQQLLDFAEKHNGVTGNQEENIIESAETTEINELHSIDSWNKFEAKALKAIQDFPGWKEEQPHISLTGNVTDWLKESIVDNTREAEIIKKFLTEKFKL